jgi:tetratricopeptide (TPR) repeat protein
MIVCPACHAENPDGTKICVKCATELPKAVEAAKGKSAPAAATKGFSLKDLGKDMVDALWLLLIILLIFVGFYYEATHGTWRFTQREEAKIVKAPAAPTPAPIKETAVAPHPHHKRPAPAAAVPAPAPPVEKPAETGEIVTGSAENFFKKGKQQYDEHHYLMSFNYLKTSLNIDPTYANAYYGLGYLYSRFGMDDAAVRMYEMALHFDPSHADSNNNLGMMYFHAGNYEDALPLFQKAVALNVTNADYQYNLGRIYLELNQLDNALQAYQTAASLRPNDATILNDMAITYEGLKRYPEAKDAWQKVMQYATNADLLKQAQAHLAVL